MLHLYSVPFNFSPFTLLLLLHLPQLLSFTSLTSHACETSSPNSSTLPSLHLPVSEVSCFPTSWVPAGKSLWAQKWQCFCSTFSNAATQQPSPRATREVLEGKDGWTTPLAIGVRDEMWPVQRSFRRLSLSEVALALWVTQMASAGQTINPWKSLIIKVSCSKCLYHHP